MSVSNWMIAIVLFLLAITALCTWLIWIMVTVDLETEDAQLDEFDDQGDSK